MKYFIKRMGGLAIGWIIVCGGVVQAANTPLSVVWTATGLNQELKNYKVSELQQFEKYVTSEKDPTTGRLVKWSGVLLSRIVDQAIKDLTNEKRAQIDLVILKSQSGQVAHLSRALTLKYPVLLALDWAKKDQDSRGPIYSVMPWSTQSRILDEELPLESFFVPQVVRVELTNYRDQFSTLFLKRRTDPSAMRGEKIFVRSCVSCHAPGSGSTLPGSQFKNLRQVKNFESVGHPTIPVTLKFSAKDRRSILHYLDAYRLEHPLSVDI